MTPCAFFVDALSRRSSLTPLLPHDLGSGTVFSLILTLSLLLDQLGEPPSRVHPVVWMGRYLTWVKGRNRAEGWAAFAQGAAYLIFGSFLFTGAAWLSVLLAEPLPLWLHILLFALLLKPTFSLHALLRAGEAVKRSLPDLPSARRLLAYHLVSRDTAALSEREVAGATVESLAENLTDSVVAPLFYFALFGLPGAVCYRFVNTADAVLGYRTPELIYFGRAAARLDDALNLIPARLAAVLLYAVLGIMRRDPAQGLRAALGATLPSPNAGWTMAMVAGGLGVTLDKRGVYVLNEGGGAPTGREVALTQRLLLGATVLGALSSIGLAHV